MATDNVDFPESEEPSNSNFDDFVETLSQFDSEGKGTVRASELRHVLMALGNPLTEEETNQVLSGQVDSNGEISIVDFVHHVLGS